MIPNTQKSNPLTIRTGYSIAAAEVPAAMARWGLLAAGKTILCGAQRRHRPDDTRHSLAVLLRGRMHWRCGPAAGRLQAGECLLMPAGIRVEREYPAGRAEQLWFVLPDITRWRGLRGTAPVTGQAVSAGQLEWTLGELYRWSISAGPVREERTGQALAELLAAYLDAQLRALTGGKKAADPRLEHLLRVVAERPGEDWSIRSLCRLTGLRPAGLHAFTIRAAGRPPLQLVTQVRMEHAKALLREGDWTVEQIAQAVGYATAYAFSNAFVRWCGCRPGAYRQQMGGW